MTSALALLCPLRGVFGWGHEGHDVVALIAEHYMTPAALRRAGDLLDGAAIDSVASWADDYRRGHPETGPWHYINIPLEDSRIDMARECPDGGCVIGKTEQFLAVLRAALPYEIPRAGQQQKTDDHGKARLFGNFSRLSSQFPRFS